MKDMAEKDGNGSLHRALIFPPDQERDLAMQFKLAFSIAATICATAATALIATPALATDTYVHHYHRAHRDRHYFRDYSGYLDPRSGHYDPEFQRNREDFGFSGRDPSRVGGEDPSLHPAPVGH